MRKIIILLITILSVSCAVSGDYESIGQIERVVFNTTGGGDLEFQVSKKNSDFLIFVNRNNFSETEIELVLTEENEALYLLLSDIFEGKHNITDDRLEVEGLTGTWTSVSIEYINNQVDEITEVNTREYLLILYDFVNTSIK